VAAPERTTGGRSVEQRIAVRWPELAHLTIASVLRLRRGSRLRRALLERTARAGYEAWNRGDLEPARAYADPEIEVHMAEGSDSPVGLDDVYYGPDGYCRAMEEWAGAEIEQWGAVLYAFRRGKILRVDGYLFQRQGQRVGAGQVD
jgi:hypothetical protein